MKNTLDAPETLAGKYTRLVIEGGEYAVKASRVKAVVKTPKLRRVPGSPSFIEGVANIDGRIVPLVNPAIRLEIEDAPAQDQRSMSEKILLMVELDSMLYGFLVDHVSSISDIPGEAVEPVNPLIIKQEFPFIAGMAKLSDQLIYLIDVDSMVLAGIDVRQTEKESYERFSSQIADILKPVKKDSDKKYLTFNVSGETFCIESSKLKSVALSSRIEPSPGAPVDMAGTISTLGGVVPVIDLKKRLALADLPYSRESRVLIIDTQGYCYGLLVHAVKELLNISEKEIKEPPAGIFDMKDQHIRGIAMLDNGEKLITLVDETKIAGKSEIESLCKREDIQMKTSEIKTPGKEKEQIKDMLVFEVADMEFAIPTADVSEVTMAKAFKPIPRAPSYIMGIISLRGEPLSVLSLRSRLGLDQNMPDSGKSRVIIIKKDRAVFGIEVDSVSGIVKIPVKDITAAPDIVKNIDTDFVSGMMIIEESDRSPMVLNVDFLIKQDAFPVMA